MENKNQKPNFYDVVIVGAGPAGAMSAMGLAEKGLRVLVLEARKDTQRKLCGEYLCPRGAKLIRDIGRGDLLEGFQNLYGMRIFSPDGNELNTTFPDAHQIPSGISVNREVFDRRLVDHARFAGAEFLFEQFVTELAQNNNIWTVKTKNSEFQCRLLIGADGRKSIVSKHMGNDLKVSEKRVALHAYLKSNSKNLRKGEMHILEGGAYVGLNPIDNFEMNISVVCDGALVRKCGGAAEAFSYVLSLSQNLSERFGEQIKNAKIYAVSPLTHPTLRQTGRNVALVGDAASFIDPLTGEGIYNAIHSSHILTTALNAEAVFDPEMRARALNTYQNIYTDKFGQKKILNTAFQWIIRRSWVVNLLGHFFRRKIERGNILIGVIGNIFTPKEGIKKLINAA